MQTQEPVLYGPQTINNGQMYGGWRPPYQQQNFVVRLISFCQAVLLSADVTFVILVATLQPPPHGSQPNQPAAPPQELTQTATIRNAVNLKKNTLRLLPLSDNPNKFSVHFVFDASSPCRSANCLRCQAFIAG